MSKTKLAVFGGIAALAAVVSVFAVQAASALTVSCAGVVSGNQVAWTATSAGGNAPVSFLWSGDSKVAGSTSTSILATYTANGTFTAMIQGTDASSSVATSSCFAVVTANTVPVATSTLNVFLIVNNSAGGTAIPSNFAVTVAGASSTPSSFTGSSAGTPVIVNANTNYSVGVSSIANYSAGMSGDCAGPIAAGASASCTVTETFVTSPTPTSTPPMPHVFPASLSINPNGQFTGHGMTVTSVASGSFQAMVWGITYTINWSGNPGGGFPEFFFRFKGGNWLAIQQVHVGDEVNVSGRIDPANPLVVNAKVIRDASITAPRKDQDNNQGGNDDRDNHGGMFVGASSSVSASSAVQIQENIQNLLNQLRGLQGLFKHGNNGNGHGGGDN